MTDGRRLFLICYDYGGGGLWGAMTAHSEDEIKAVYPELTIVHERPPWMTEERFAQICEEELHDIDGGPWGLLNVLLADRGRR